MDPVDPAAMRISDADRHRVAELLREAAGEGRLDVEELEERLEATYAAKTYGDLVPITLDLPGNPSPGLAVPGPATPAPRGPRPVMRPGPVHESSYAVMSETKRVGPWTLTGEHTAVAVMGSVVLDLREVALAGREVTINAHAVMGSVEVIVDAETLVRVDGVPIMGSYQMGRESVSLREEADSPLVNLKGVALMGSVEVKRKGPRRIRRGGA